jgi:hypothetical protein
VVTLYRWAEKVPGMLEVFLILVQVVVSWANVCVKMYQPAHLRCKHFMHVISQNLKINKGIVSVICKGKKCGPFPHPS